MLTNITNITSIYMQQQKKDKKIEENVSMKLKMNLDNVRQRKKLWWLNYVREWIRENC